MKRLVVPVAIIATFIAGSFVGSALTSPAVAQVVSGAIKGGGHIGAVRERFKFKTLRGSSHRADCEREVIVVPQEYGNLVRITPDPTGRIILWYEDDKKNLRNVFVNREDALLQISRQSGLSTETPLRGKRKKK